MTPSGSKPACYPRTPLRLRRHRAPRTRRRAEEHNEQTGDPDGTADTASHSAASAALLLGMSRPEIQALPDARYTAFLEGILQTLRGALAPTA
ncbi:hypothetical protein GCM10010246_09540 [Streptomyces cuspidosporus]|uniref:Tetracyclin repressor-like C-terminal domain-containing protein n=1 Tax=Streptomyces cuspidosporus TaxID=66882 RepID=A0ABP5SDV3_9ACTN